jgi:hypothetical protein
MTSRLPPRRIFSSASRRALPRMVPSRRAHGMLRLSSFSCWSRNSASSGEIEDHRLVEDHRRDLVAGRLAEAGRQHDEDVAAPRDVRDDPLLLRVETVDAEPARRLVDLAERRLGRLGDGAARPRPPALAPAPIVVGPFGFGGRRLAAPLFPTGFVQVTCRLCHGDGPFLGYGFLAQDGIGRRAGDRTARSRPAPPVGRCCRQYRVAKANFATERASARRRHARARGSREPRRRAALTERPSRPFSVNLRDNPRTRR